MRERKSTIREIKHVLRLANLKYQKLSDSFKKNCDVRVLILFTYCNYHHETVSEYYNQDNRKKMRLVPNFWGKKYLIMLANNVNETRFNQHSYKMDMPIFISGHDTYYTPKFEDNFLQEEKGYHLSDMYLNIF